MLIWGKNEIKEKPENRPFPSSLVPLFQNGSMCQTFHMKMSSACSFIFMQIKVIFIRMVSHLDLLETEAQRNAEMTYQSILYTTAVTEAHQLNLCQARVE